MSLPSDYDIIDKPLSNNLPFPNPELSLIDDQFKKNSTNESHEENVINTKLQSSPLSSEPKHTFLPDSSQTENSRDSKTKENIEPRSIVNKYVTIELSVFLCMLGYSFIMTTDASLMIQKVCRVTYNYTDAECQNYTNNPVAYELIQARSADLSMYYNLLQTIPAVSYSLFLGPWSDKHGRKLTIVLPIFGLMCCTLCNLLLSYYITTFPEYMLIGSAFFGLSGGTVSLILGYFSYVSDITTCNDRTRRIALLEAVSGIPLPIGLILSSLIQKHWGYVSVYGTALAILSLTFLYSTFVLPETIQASIPRKGCMFNDMFNVKNVIDSLRVCFKKQNGNNRKYICLLLTCLFAILLTSGEASVMLLFVQAKFGWTSSDLSIYQAYSTYVVIVGSGLLSKFVFAKYKLPDTVLEVIGLVGTILNEVTIGVSFVGWMMYLGALISFFQFFTIPTIRSFMTKLVEKGDVGKLFALTSSVEAIVPIISVVVYTQLYKASFQFFLGVVFVFSACLLVIPLMLFCWIHLKMKQEQKTTIKLHEIEEESGIDKHDV